MGGWGKMGGAAPGKGGVPIVFDAAAAAEVGRKAEQEAVHAAAARRGARGKGYSAAATARGGGAAGVLATATTAPGFKGGKGGKSVQPSKEVPDVCGATVEFDEVRGGGGGAATARTMVGKEVGVGTFGRVFETQQSDGRPPRVLKVMRDTARYLHHSNDAAREYRILCKIGDVDKEQACLRVFGMATLPERCVGVWMEAFRHNLFHYVGEGRRAVDVRVAARQLLEQVRVMHSAFFIHTDIKHKNIMVTPGADPAHDRIVIIDYGSGVFPGDAKPDVVVTKPFRPPETHARRSWGFGVDVFALGMTLGWLHAGKAFFRATLGTLSDGRPFCGADGPGAGGPALADVVREPALRSLLSAMLQLDPDTRCSAEFAAAHNYVRGE